MKASEMLEKLREMERELENFPVSVNSNFSREYPFNISIPDMISGARTRINLAIADLAMEIQEDGDKDLRFYRW